MNASPYLDDNRSLPVTYLVDCKIPEVSYLGTQNVTERGFECQTWDKQYPHRHSYGSYPGARENYCRDFDSDEPWCLTTNRKVVWDRCIVPSCGVNVTANSSSCASIDELDISELKNERSCGSYCNWIRTTINDAITKRNLQNGRTCGIRDKKKIVRKHEQLLQRGTYTPWMCSISIFDGNKDDCITPEHQEPGVQWNKEILSCTRLKLYILFRLKAECVEMNSVYRDYRTIHI
ncbi:uncharacterized protein LOC125648644 [Ostrea edulis]|uniref:uncharacterized protein LOC125648644 n=1 Tax=Ostrea edulis TaxID=37623 RepID=UPI0024AEAB32|nr:uncharacterized protein LOC125648644 [Ostrea edulis]